MKQIATVLCLLIILVACKKRDPIQLRPHQEGSLQSFSVESELSPSVIDQDAKTVFVTIGLDQDWTQLEVEFETTGNVALLHNSIPLKSGISTIDFTKPVDLVLSSSTGVVTRLQVEVTSDLEKYGLGNVLQEVQNLDTDYDNYEDQGESGRYNLINCGPAVVTMALKWSDAEFKKTTEQARQTIRSAGGWWFTDDVQHYIALHDVHMTYVSLDTVFDAAAYGTKIKQILDMGYGIILCLDMHHIQHNPLEQQKVNKFYKTGYDGWGHFVFVKGYKVVDDVLWLQTDDSFSLNEKYEDGTYKGKNRYYAASELKKATDQWWPYAMVIAKKGQRIIRGEQMSPDQIKLIQHQRG